ncbi:hypothetical protein INR49_020619 [Caranx melampygus]|nr:hypothetical protein INR49_020619 [Caranx melampygus]
MFLKEGGGDSRSSTETILNVWCSSLAELSFYFCCDTYDANENILYVMMMMMMLVLVFLSFGGVSSARCDVRCCFGHRSGNCVLKPTNKGM